MSVTTKGCPECHSVAPPRRRKRKTVNKKMVEMRLCGWCDQWYDAKRMVDVVIKTGRDEGGK